ncbi:MAG TPA: hypothetical protein VEA81_03730 [Burkholderiaceae bacterium]|nr:hypothetical protein [Burkholderiaceae bacterium]
MDRPVLPHRPRLAARRWLGAAIDVAGALLIGHQVVAWIAG